jgi:hypothetical protein
LTGAVLEIRRKFGKGSVVEIGESGRVLGSVKSQAAVEVGSQLVVEFEGSSAREIS